MRTYVRERERAVDPARGRRRLLRLGRATRRSEPPRPPGDRRRRGRDGRQLRGAAPRGPRGDERRPRPPPLPRRGRRPAPVLGLRAGQRASCSSSSPRPRPWSRGCRSRRPSSTSVDSSGSRAHRSEIAATLRRRARERIGLPVTVGIARTKTLAKMASRAAKPDGLLLVAPAREREFLHPLAGRGALGRRRFDRPQAQGRGNRDGRPARRAERRPALATVVGRAAGRHLHAVARNRDPRRVRSGRRRRSFGSQSALGRWSGSAPGARRGRRLARRPDHQADAGRGERRPHGHGAAALRRLHPGQPLRGRCRRRPRQPAPC